MARIHPRRPANATDRSVAAQAPTTDRRRSRQTPGQGLTDFPSLPPNQVPGTTTETVGTTSRHSRSSLAPTAVRIFLDPQHRGGADDDGQRSTVPPGATVALTTHSPQPPPNRSPVDDVSTGSKF